MNIENCIKCPHHISYTSGYVICNYWKRQQQHVTHSASGGTTRVVGCAIREKESNGR